MSWEDLEKFDIHAGNDEKIINRFCSISYELFEKNGLGVEFYEYLHKHAMKPVCPPAQKPSFGYFREGQNSLYHQINQSINYHKSKLKGER